MANEQITAGVWAAVARAAADHRRVVGAEDRVFYDDLTGRCTGDACAWQRRRAVIAHGLEVGVPDEDLVDALISGDPQLDVNEAHELITWERHRKTQLVEINAALARAITRERD